MFKIIRTILFIMPLFFCACDSANPVEPEAGWYPFGNRIPEQGTIWFYNYYDYNLWYTSSGEKDESWSKGTFKIEITSSSKNSQPPFFTIEKTSKIDTVEHEYTEIVTEPYFDIVLRSKVETNIERKYQYKIVLVTDSLYYEIEGEIKLFSPNIVLRGTSINALLFCGRDLYLKAFSEYGNPSFVAELEKSKGITQIKYFDAWMGISGYNKSFSCNLIEYIPGRN
jgi:hypothetical protein